MKKTLLLNSFLLCLFWSAFAQNREIKGKVTDESGLPLSGANVIAKGSKTGTQTNKDGLFTLTVQGSGAVELTISYTGYKAQTVSYAGQAEVAVQLQKDANQLEDVVVI